MRAIQLILIGTVVIGMSSCKPRSTNSEAGLKAENNNEATNSGAAPSQNDALTNPNMDLNVVDFDIRNFPEAPNSPKAPPEVTNFGIDPYIGGYEIWPGYKIKGLDTWIAQDEADKAAGKVVAVTLADCFRKSYWRLYKILQNPPAEYLDMVKNHQGPGGFYVFINDVRTQRQVPAWDNKLVNYKDSLVKWLGNWDGRTCTQRTRKDLIEFSKSYSQSHPSGWRDRR